MIIWNIKRVAYCPLKHTHTEGRKPSKNERVVRRKRLSAWNYPKKGKGEEKPQEEQKNHKRQKTPGEPCSSDEKETSGAQKPREQEHEGKGKEARTRTSSK